MRHKQFKKEGLLARYFIYLETHVSGKYEKVLRYAVE